jgi:hypothetical protein
VLEFFCCFFQNNGNIKKAEFSRQNSAFWGIMVKNGWLDSLIFNAGEQEYV